MCHTRLHSSYAIRVLLFYVVGPILALCVATGQRHRALLPTTKKAFTMSRKNNTAAVAPVATAPVTATAPVAPVAPVAPALPATAAAILALPQIAAAPVAPKAANAKKWPKAGGKCWQVWQQCQQLADSGQHVNVAHLRAWAIANNANVSNATQEFYAWRKFVASNS